MKKFSIACLAALTAVVLLAGCSKQETNSLPESTVHPNSVVEKVWAKPADARLLDALAENQDAAAWITFPNTDIDALVMQSEDNEYYLRKDTERNYSIDGCYFADYENTLSSSREMSRNIILYGHYFTQRPDLYFGQLWNLANNADLAKENRTIYLSLPDKMLEYEVVSIGLADAKTDTLAITANPTKSELTEILNMAKERSMYDFDFNPETVDNILTLSTCSDNANERLIVVAVLKTEL